MKNFRSVIIFILVLALNPIAFAKDTKAIAPVTPAVADAAPSIEKTAESRADANCNCYNKWHGRFGYLTAAMAIGAVATHEEEKEASDSHRTFGMLTAASLLATGYFGWKANNPNGNDNNSKKLHRILGWASVPLIIALAASGIDADGDYKDGKKPDGIGEQKGALTGLTVATLAATVGLVHFEF